MNPNGYNFCWKNKGGQGDADRNSKSHSFAVFIFPGDFRLRLPKGVTLISGIFASLRIPNPQRKLLQKQIRGGHKKRESGWFFRSHFNFFFQEKEELEQRPNFFLRRHRKHGGGDQQRPVGNRCCLPSISTKPV